MPSLIRKFRLFKAIAYLVVFEFISILGYAAEIHHVRGLVGSHTKIPCLLSSDRLSMIDHQASYYDDNLNRTYDSIRLILFYKESIKTGPIYSIDNRNTQSLRLAKHFASETFQNRLSIDDNLDLNNTTNLNNDKNSSQRKNHAKIVLVGENVDNLIDGNNLNALNSSSNNLNSFSLTSSSSTNGLQLLGVNIPLETPHHYHHYQQQLEQLKKQPSNDYILDTIYLRIDELKSSDTGDYKCRVDFRRGRTLTTHANLKVIVPPTDIQITELDNNKSTGLTLSVDEETDVRFLCSASSANPVPYFSWQLNNQPIPQHLSTSLSTLRQQDKLKKQNKDHGTEFINSNNQSNFNKEKVITFKKATQDNEEIILKQNLIQFKNYTFNENLNILNKSFIISKSANDLSLNKVKLATNTFATVNYISPAELTTTTGSVLLLRNLTKAEINSVLSCSALHPLYPHPVNVSIKLDINLKPTLIELEKAKKALISNKTASFKCTSWGSRPPAEIKWYLNNQLLDNSKETICTNGNCTTSILNLSLTPDHDQQNLICKARNTRLKQDFSLEAFTQLNIFYEPILNLTVESMNLTEGDSLKLTCESKSKPPTISFSWKFNDEKIKMQSNIKIANKNNSSILIIKNITRDQSGKYNCLARNLIGEKISQQIDIQINYAPRCKNNQKFVYGTDFEEKLRILCDVEAQPLPTRFYWSVQPNQTGASRQPLQQFHASGSRSSALFEPTNRNQLGDVFCSAENSVGLQVNPCIFHIIPAGRPDALNNCVFVKVDSEEIQISCEPSFDGGLSQIFHLEVYLKLIPKLKKQTNSTILMKNNLTSSFSITSTSQKYSNDEKIEHVLVQNITNNLKPSFIARSLNPGKLYYFVIYSSNLKGRSKRPLELNTRTLNISYNRNQTLSTFVSIPAPPFATMPLSVLTNFNSAHLSYLLGFSCLLLLILLFKVRASKTSSLTNQILPDSTDRNSNITMNDNDKIPLEFQDSKDETDKAWLHNKKLSSILPHSSSEFLENTYSGHSKNFNQQAILNDEDCSQLEVILNDNDIMTQSTNITLSYLQQQFSKFDQLSHQQIYLQQHPQQIILNTKSPELLDQLYQNNEFELIDSKKLQETDPHNLLIISKSDHSFKEAILNDPLLPLQTKLPILNSDQNGLINETNNLHMDLYKHSDNFNFDQLKNLNPNCLSSSIDSNFANVMNLNFINNQKISNLISNQNYESINKNYFLKNTVDAGQITFSTLNNSTNQIDSNIPTRSNNLQASKNLLNKTENSNTDFIEMSINNPTTIYAINVDDKSSNGLPFVSNV